MASLDSLIAKRLAALESVPEAFITATEAAERAMYRKAIEVLKRFKLDANGNLIPNQTNYSYIYRMGEDMADVFSQNAYMDAMEAYGKSFITQAATNNQIMEASGIKLPNTDRYMAMVEEARNRTLEALSKDSLRQTIVKPIERVLVTATNASVSFKEAVQTLETELLSSETANGRLIRYAKMDVHDAFAISDRTYSEAVAAATGVQFYRYLGGLVRDSREFCITRQGKVWHIEEIKSWGRLKSWDGRNPATNADTITQYLGGYNCMHVLVPLPLTRVPADKIAEAKRKGWLKES